MLNRRLLALAFTASMIIASGVMTDVWAKEKDKGGTYLGGEGSSHKGGQYLPPYGRRYDRGRPKPSQQPPKAKPAPATPAALESAMQ